MRYGSSARLSRCGSPGTARPTYRHGGALGIALKLGNRKLNFKNFHRNRFIP